MKKWVAVLIVLCLSVCLITATASDTWYCPNCGRKNDSNFCPVDKTARPSNIGTQTVSNVHVGSIVTMGTYPQTSAGRDSTPIEWIVLDTDGQEALLISRYSLDCQPYNTVRCYVTWETSSIRTWLNSTFLYSAFSYDEIDAIQFTTVMNGRNHCYHGASWRSEGGNDTLDQVFLLSYTECWQYFKSDGSRKCRPTDYAAALDAYYDVAQGSGGWWLRTPAYEDLDAAFVMTAGTRGSRYVDSTTLGVRPAMWVDLSAIQ